MHARAKPTQAVKEITAYAQYAVPDIQGGEQAAQARMLCILAKYDHLKLSFIQHFYGIHVIRTMIPQSDIYVTVGIHSFAFAARSDTAFYHNRLKESRFYSKPAAFNLDRGAAN